MKLYNETTKHIQVAVNRWGDKGNTGYCRVSPGKTETWSRSDTRGFIMSIERAGETAKPYFVTCESEVKVYKDKITESASTIQPLA
ncbi:MAG: hypothetical protein AAGA80_01775 [Cyanobacteria bacterium P01_F01_bin.143]